MVTHTIEDGWALIQGGFVSGITCGMSLRCQWEFTEKRPEVTIEHYPGDGTYGFDLGTRIRTVGLRDVMFTNRVDAEAALECFEALNGQISGFTLQLQVHSTGTLFKMIGGTGNTMRVLCRNISKVEKLVFGDTQIYKIGMIKLEQCRHT